ncbi:Phosphonate ABC transporter ATP-binding protein (TC 3.A.1.9.1) [plant metagenome]|uniref:Phosphonate ABC transporter ATP-binding protein (TC 3.A.1.9.1) n=1 Tax=plant metagenome TaxID=1297885 RepID=A0A484QE25_9ZZZZ
MSTPASNHSRSGPGASGPLLALRQLVKRYPTGDLALDHVDLDVPQGQVMALIGPSGAGKSTLIRCVNRLVQPSGGQILLNGQDLGTLGRHGLRLARRQLGMIFQEYALVERLTVMENVLSGRLGYTSFWRSWTRRYPAQDIQQAYGFLARVGLAGFENKRADALSGGQRQRVGIARALMQAPVLLLVDEPTASLDPKTARQIMRLLCELCRERGLSAIVNIHDVALASQFADRIVGLRKGAIVYDGAPQGLDTIALTAIYGEEDWGAAGHGDTGQADKVEPETPAVPDTLTLATARA